MILRLDAKDSQIIKVRRINLVIEIRDPIEEMIFHDKKESG